MSTESIPEFEFDCPLCEKRFYAKHDISEYKIFGKNICRFCEAKNDNNNRKLLWRLMNYVDRKAGRNISSLII